MWRMLSRASLVLCCLAVSRGFVRAGLPALGYHVNITDSLPRGLYKETHEEITRGSLVMECLPQPLAALATTRGWIGRGSCPNGTMPLAKRVEGLPGDTVEFADRYVAVNGRVLLGTASLHLDSSGRWIPVVTRGTGVLQADEYVLIADNIVNSLDSRYFGPVKRENILGTVKPVWVEAAHGE